MSTGDFARLRKWAEDDGHELNVTPPASRSDKTWAVSVDLSDPVKVRASGHNADIDAAAAEVIAVLLAVGEAVP